MHTVGLFLLAASCLCFALSGCKVESGVNFDGLGKMFAIAAAGVMVA